MLAGRSAREPADYSLPELAEAVNRWAAAGRLAPANGQVGEAVTERSLRFYRTIGLLDAPSAGGGRGYTEKHFLQLAAVRLLQAQGLPLRRIRELLHGRSLAELREIRARGLAEARSRTPAAPAFRPGESWTLTPVGGDFAILSRRGELSPEQRQRIREILED